MINNSHCLNNYIKYDSKHYHNEYDFIILHIFITIYISLYFIVLCICDTDLLNLNEIFE